MNTGDKSKMRAEEGKPSRLRPNEATIQAIEAAPRGDLTSARSIEKLFVHLNNDDR